MRKIITVFLAVAMMFALCGSAVASNDATTELTPREKEAIFYEVAYEKGILSEVMELLNGNKNAETAGNQVVYIPRQAEEEKPDKYPLNDLPEELAEPIGDENFVIEAFRTEAKDYRDYIRYDMSLKIRNLTEYNPPETNYLINYTLIDKNGDSLTVTRGLGSTDIPPSGTTQWLTASPDVEDVAGIRLLGYHVYGKGNLRESFDTPIDFYYEDYKITYRKMY